MDISKQQAPSREELLANLDKVSSILDKLYLYHLSRDFVVVPFESYNNREDGSYSIGYDANIRGIRVLRWVYDKEEKLTDRFKNVLTVFSQSDSSLALVIRRTAERCEMLFCLKNETAKRSRKEDSIQNIALLEKALLGNFPGTQAVEEDIDEDWIGLQKPKSIASLTSIPSEKSEDFISQGLEKLLDGIVPQGEEDSYTVLLLAEPMTQEQISAIRSGYEELASALQPFSEYQFSLGTNSGTTESELTSLTKTDSINSSITKTNSVNAGINLGVNDNVTKAANIFKKVFKMVAGGEQGTSHGTSTGISAGFSHSRATTEGEGRSIARGVSRDYGVTEGTSRTTNYSYKSYSIANMLEKLALQCKRIENGRALGMWNFASYVIANNAQMSLDVANFLRSLMQGDQSYIEASAINHWEPDKENGGERETEDFKNVLAYIRHFVHPIFANTQDVIRNDFQYDPAKTMTMTPASPISTSELAGTVSFPHRSVSGLPALVCARFGRNVMPSGLEEDIAEGPSGLCPLGSIYHMHNVEKTSPVALARNELTAHTFITGSTGSGKSNTIYKILDELCFRSEDPAKFLVIEPAKGEYKDVFGGRPSVSVYGTNPKKAPLLRFNPFSFPNDIHVLEHIDRLVEVFNACWPMYAAMPAILKDAIEASYVSCGWSLRTSRCFSGGFPTFEVLLKKLPEVIDSSEYSSDTKGDYIGALKTRVKSLTNGINGQIFCAVDEIPDGELFDRNVIVDLSRIGSMETKALLMGILMIKLQEYRMSGGEGPNAVLRHVTVLEEAHNLLRRTSPEQSQESSNLQGKSVEMLSNAIAEMRTYGEGFIIADQSPGLLDLSVIRNTNTKIIMHLPEESDRVLAGKAAGLNNDQIVELAKLRRGVAAVYQNGWLEPVLCMVDRFPEKEKKKLSYQSVEQAFSPVMDAFFERFLHGPERRRELTEEDVDGIRRWIDCLHVREEIRNLMRKTEPLSEQERGCVLYELLSGWDIIRQAQNCENPAGIVERAAAEQLRVSAELAREIRERVFVYAAENLNPRNSNTYEILMRYGGIS